jgi:hypothetical protein
MRNLHAALAVAALSAGVGAPISEYARQKELDAGLFVPDNRRGKGQRNRRGKGAISRPKKRPNRLTISKRVRRKHRRAA